MTDQCCLAYIYLYIWGAGLLNWPAYPSSPKQLGLAACICHLCICLETTSQPVGSLGFSSRYCLPAESGRPACSGDGAIWLRLLPARGQCNQSAGAFTAIVCGVSRYPSTVMDSWGQAVWWRWSLQAPPSATSEWFHAPFSCYSSTITDIDWYRGMHAVVCVHVCSLHVHLCAICMCICVQPMGASGEVCLLFHMCPWFAHSGEANCKHAQTRIFCR